MLYCTGVFSAWTSLHLWLKAAKLTGSCQPRAPKKTLNREARREEMTRRPKKRKAGSCLEGPVWPGCGAGHGRCSGISCWAVSGSDEQKRRELGPWCRQGDCPWATSQGGHHLNGTKARLLFTANQLWREPSKESERRRLAASQGLRESWPFATEEPYASEVLQSGWCHDSVASPANSGMNFSPRRWHHSWPSLTWSVRARSGKACYVKTTPNRMARRLAH